MCIFAFLDICLTTLDIMSTKKGKHMPAPCSIFLSFFFFKVIKSLFPVWEKCYHFDALAFFMTPWSLFFSAHSFKLILQSHEFNSHLVPDKTQIFDFDLPSRLLSLRPLFQQTTRLFYVVAPHEA